MPQLPRDLDTLVNLAIYARNHYQATGLLEDLNLALACWQEALELTPPDSPDRPNRLNNLGVDLRERYARTGALPDLERGITVCQQAVDTAPADSPKLPIYLNNLSNGLLDRYARTGALPDLKRGIAALQQAVDTTPADSPNRPGYLTNLGLGLRDYYARTGVLSDLERAITDLQQAVDTTPADSPNRPRCLSNLGLGLLDRYARTGVLSDLERAITAYQQAVDTTPADAPDRPRRLTNLGNGLLTRYRRTGVLSDLERAITAYQQAVDTTPADAPDRPRRLTNLGNGLFTRYRRTKALPDLERAITAFQQAVDTTPANAPDRHRRLGSLGMGFLDRYRHKGMLSDLGRAITVCQQAVDTMPADSPELPMHLSNLGLGLLARYGRTGVLSDLERAITALQQAVDVTPADSPERPGYLGNLGLGLFTRYGRNETLSQLERAITAWEEGWSLLHPRFSVLPVVYQLGQQREVVDISTSLITAYLERAARHPPSAQLDCRRALEVAEGGKSRLLTQLVGRGPLPLPAGLSSEVAAREQYLLLDLTALDTLELATHDRPAPAWEEDRALNRLEQRHEIWHELQQLWDGIAKTGEAGAGYVALRRGDTPTWNDVVRLTEDLGPATAVLSLFTTDYKVGLFIIRAGWSAPLVVEAALDRLGWDDLYGRFVREVYWYDRRRPLQETWEGSLRPLLDQAKAHLEGVERLILVPVGIGHLLPWGVLAEHAGWRTQSGQPLPLVVLPALGVLPRLRRRPHIPTSPALVVGNPTGDLPFAKEEANTVAALFGVSPLLDAAATKATVLARFEQASLIHLATHAFFDPNAPLEASIVLADGTLTAREVLEHHLHADLLVLSACESGQASTLGGEELAGLSQAFFQAGVRSLLVSLWPVSDPATAALMSAFYTAWQAGTDKAQALRQAMTQLQQNPRWTHPHYWSAFVLMGDWD